MFNCLKMVFTNSFSRSHFYSGYNPNRTQGLFVVWSIPFIFSSLKKQLVSFIVRYDAINGYSQSLASFGLAPPVLIQVSPL